MPPSVYSGPLWLDIDQIDLALRPASLMRETIDAEAIADYAGHLDDLPPIKVAVDAADHHWLEDGSYRVRAAIEAGRTRVSCLVRTGDFDSAFQAACRANATHGVRVTNADKRKRVEAALAMPGYAGMSNIQVAKICGVSDWTVGKIRPETSENLGRRVDTLGRRIAPKKKKDEANPDAESAGAVEADRAGDPTTAPGPAIGTCDDPPEDGTILEADGDGHLVVEDEDEDEGDLVPDEDERDLIPDEDVSEPAGSEDLDWCRNPWDPAFLAVETAIRSAFDGLPEDQRAPFLFRAKSLISELLSTCPGVVDRGRQPFR